jgi:hypothetical protein
VKASEHLSLLQEALRLARARKPFSDLFGFIPTSQEIERIDRVRKLRNSIVHGHPVTYRVGLEIWAGVAGVIASITPTHKGYVLATSIQLASGRRVLIDEDGNVVDYESSMGARTQGVQFEIGQMVLRPLVPDDQGLVLPTFSRCGRSDRCRNILRVQQVMPTGIVRCQECNRAVPLDPRHLRAWKVAVARAGEITEPAGAPTTAIEFLEGIAQAAVEDTHGTDVFQVMKESELVSLLGRALRGRLGVFGVEIRGPNESGPDYIVIDHKTKIGLQVKTFSDFSKKGLADAVTSQIVRASSEHDVDAFFLLLCTDGNIHRNRVANLCARLSKLGENIFPLKRVLTPGVALRLLSPEIETYHTS